MKRIAFHVAFCVGLVVLLVVGVAANVHVLAVFTGMLAGTVFDPVLLLGALMIGGFSPHLKALLPAAIVFGILLSIYIANLNAELGATLTLFVTFVRIVAVTGLALIANAVRIIASRPEQ